MMSDLVATLDVGKTHSRLTLIEAQSAKTLWRSRRENESVDTPLGRQLDVAGTERWLIEAMRDMPNLGRIVAIVPIAHGAAAMLVDDQGQLLAAMDYEEARFAKVNEAYAAERDLFDQTYSPSLPLGLNLGRQLFYLQHYEPRLFKRVRNILLHPQFWAWRLSATMASEVTSLGCHSDLWLPHTRTFSSLARRRGWSTLFPPLRSAGDTLGRARGSLAQTAGLPPDCRVLCGIHDSNASYLRYLVRRREESFAVISSGTWTVVMANNAPFSRLHADYDMLANIDAFGSPVATARFMGGREYQAIAHTGEQPTFEALLTVMEKNAMALPAFAAGGPFAGSRGRMINADGLDAAASATLATLYVALMSDLALDLLGAQGDIIVDGPVIANPLFTRILASLRHGSRILIDDGQSDAIASCHLAGYSQGSLQSCSLIEPMTPEPLRRYRDEWRSQLPAPQAISRAAALLPE